MERSRLVLERTSSSERDDPQTEIASRSSRLPLWLTIGSVIVGGIWFFQRGSIRHLNEQIHQLQQDIDRLPNRSVTPAARVNLAKEQILLERDRINAQNGVYNILFQGVGAIILGGLVCTGWQYLRRTDEQFQRAESPATYRSIQSSDCPFS